MRKKLHSKIVWLLLICAVVIMVPAITVYAHPGKTDANGGHIDHSTGEYHYHHGYPAHFHDDIDGDGTLDCPYDFDDQTDHVTDNEYSSTINDIYDDTIQSDYDFKDDSISESSFTDFYKPDKGSQIESQTETPGTNNKREPIILKLLEFLLAAFTIGVGVTYFLSYIIFLFFEKLQDHIVKIFFIIFLIAYIVLIVIYFHK